MFEMCIPPTEIMADLKAYIEGGLVSDPIQKIKMDKNKILACW